MVYMNFNKITPPAPNDPLVDEATQLNANWDTLDTKMKPYYEGGVVSDIEVGQEYFNSNFDFTVWNGSSGVIPKEIPAGWTAWTNLPLSSPISPRPGSTPRWRNNPLYRMVELSGGVLSDSSANPWAMGITYTLTAQSTGAPPASFVPVGGKHIQPCAVGATTGTSIVAGGYITIDLPSGSSFVRIRGQHLGGATLGNFIALDSVWWWY